MTSSPVTVSLRTGTKHRAGRGVEALRQDAYARRAEPVLHSVFGMCFGGTSTVPPWKAPDPRKVIPFLRIWTLWWYTPGLTNTVSPGLAALIAA